MSRGRSRPAQSLRRKRRTFVVGAPPGTLAADPEAPKPAIYAFGYKADAVHEQVITNVDDIKTLLNDWPVVWINVDGLGDASIIEALGRIFGLHPLALEDVVNVQQRPKVETYDTYQFIVLRMVTLGTEVTSDQMSMFLGKSFVLTFQEHAGDCFNGVRDRLRKGSPRLRSSGPDYLAYALIDALVDHYFPSLEQVGDRLDALQEAVIAKPSMDTVRELNDMKRGLLQLRRAIWPLRDELSSLLRESPFVTKETATYLRDCYDHTIVLMDVLESSREISNSLMDVYLSSVSYRTNEVMQFLTIIATIFIPLTFIVGVYGMNFNPQSSPWNMPELNWYWGYPAVLGSMLVTAVGLLGYFWRKGWLRAHKLR